jgi:hypothetical protein
VSKRLEYVTGGVEKGHGTRKGMAKGRDMCWGWVETCGWGVFEDKKKKGHSTHLKTRF